MALNYNNEKYIILYKDDIACFEKFPDEFSAKIWALHNGLAFYKVINLLGDKIIVLKYGVVIKKLK